MKSTPTLYSLRSQQFIHIVKIVFSLIIGLILILQTLETSAAPPLQGPPAAPSLSRGAALWPTNCAPCHGQTGLGDGPTAAALDHPPANFADVALARERTLVTMYDVIANGRIERLMPPWKNQLSEQQMWDVAVYARSLAVDPATLAQGELVYAQSCAECHGEAGLAAEIDLTDPELLVAASDQTLFSRLRAGDAPHDALTTLSDEAVWQSLAFVHTLSLDKPVLDGQLTGVLRNGTTGDILADNPVNLYALSGTGDILDVYSGQSDEAGRFSFTDLNIDHTLSYVLEGVYQGVRYTSPEPVLFLPDSNEIAQDLLLFDVTENVDVVTQQRFHRIMVFDQNQIRLADVYVFEAEGNQTYIGQTGEDGQVATLKVALPANAFEVQFQDESIRGFGDYYVSQQPVIPGQETFISVQYNLPFSGSDVRLETPLYYEVGAINILAADVGQTIESAMLQFDGTETFQGNTYQLLRGTNPTANQPLVMEITNIDVPAVVAPSGRPQNAIVPEAVGQDQTILLASILGIGTVTLIFSLFYSRTSPQRQSDSSQDDREKQYVLLMLAELERQHAADEIDSATYQRLRSQSRANLRRILVQEKGLSA